MNKTSNHPHRAWRRRMHEAARQWLASFRWPASGSAGVLGVSEVRDLMLLSYRSGYIAGRKSTTKKPEQCNAE